LRTVPSEDRDKFDWLSAAVEQQLSGVTVYKVGDEPGKAVHIIGTTADGEWAGLKTSVRGRDVGRVRAVGVLLD
jgi:hypothetical protein